MAFVEHPPHDRRGGFGHVRVDQEEGRVNAAVSQDVQQRRRSAGIRAVVVGQIDCRRSAAARHVPYGSRRGKALEHERKRRRVCEEHGGEARDEEPQHVNLHAARQRGRK